MPTCHHCGEEIEFRYVDGRCVPIHPNGGWHCGSWASSGSGSSGIHVYAPLVWQHANLRMGSDRWCGCRHARKARIDRGSSSLTGRG